MSPLNAIYLLTLPFLYSHFLDRPHTPLGVKSDGGEEDTDTDDDEVASKGEEEEKSLESSPTPKGEKGSKGDTPPVRPSVVTSVSSMITSPYK